MSKVEFNNCFFVELIKESYVGHTPGWDCPDLWALPWSGAALATCLEGYCEPWLLLCWDTPGLCPWDHQSSGVGIFSRARAWQGLRGCLGQEPQKGMLVTELTRDAFPLGVVRVEVTALGSGRFTPTPWPHRRSRYCRREWESCSFLALLGLGSPPSPSNNFSLYKLSLAHLQRQLCTLTCFFLTTVNYAGFLWQTYLTFLILFFLFSTALSKI